MLVDFIVKNANVARLIADQAIFLRVQLYKKKTHLKFNKAMKEISGQSKCVVHMLKLDTDLVKISG